MAKPKTKSSKVAAPAHDILTKVKDAAIIKPSQTVKAKSKEIVKLVASEEDMESKSKKAKEPTPELVESESEDESDGSARSADGESKKEIEKPVEPQIDQPSPQPRPKLQKPPRPIPWASTNKGIGVMTRKRGLIINETTAAAQVNNAEPDAQTESSSPEPPKTGLGKGKTVPSDRRNAHPKAHVTWSKGRKPHLNNQKKFEESKIELDLEGSTLVEDQECAIDENDPVGRTLVGDQERATNQNDPVRRTLVEDDETLDSESDSAVDDNEHLQETIDELSQTAMVGNLVAAVTLKALVLPSPGDVISTYQNPFLADTLASLQDSFNDYGSLLSFNDPEKQATQFTTAILSVLLVKREALKASAQGFSLSAFLCTVAEMIPQLEAFTTFELGTHLHQNFRTRAAWELLVTLMEVAVANYDNSFIPVGWSRAGIVALEKLDEIGMEILEKRIYCAPNTVNEDLILMKYVDVDWLKRDLVRLRCAAFLADDEVLEAGFLLQDTVKAMEDFLRDAAEQLRRAGK